MRVTRSNDADVQRLEGPELAALVALQAQDQRIADLEKRRSGKPGELASRERELAKQRASSDEIRGLVTSVKKAIDSRNLAAETIEQNITKLDGQLMTLKSNDEFEKMKAQIADRKTALSDEQDKALELMMKLDELQERQGEEDKRCGELETLVTKAKEKMKTDLERLETDIAAAQGERDAAAAQVSDSLRTVYEEVAERGEGVGIVPLRTEDNTCGGCFTEVRSQMLGKVMASHLAQCPYCDRILYLSERLQG